MASVSTTGLPLSVCVVCCAFIMAVSVYELLKVKAKLRAFKTEENVIRFCFLSLFPLVIFNENVTFSSLGW